jgi:hypothetical protein
LRNSAGLQAFFQSYSIAFNGRDILISVNIDAEPRVWAVLAFIFQYAVKYPGRVFGALASDPVGLWDAVHDGLDQRRQAHRPAPHYQVTADWERQLHELLGVAWPCQAISEFRSLWMNVVGAVEATGIEVGPQSFNGFNDGDAGLVRAIWCLIRHLKPAHVVETGVARGFTSRFIIEALESNRAGHLSSIDKPPMNPLLQQQIGIAVGDRYPGRWTLIKGTSKRHLPKLLSRLGLIDIFIHDSLHTEPNVRFELDRAWAALRPGGALVVDDVDTNCGFQSFAQAHADCPSLVCEAEPIRPDPRRFNNKGLFGIILKKPRRT